ncbi:hypothetical protein EsHS_00000625 [Epichloe bromicola]
MAFVTPILEQWQRLGLAAVAAILVWKLLLHPVFLSPLSRVPAAHPLASFSTIWIQWHRWRGSDFDAVAAAFDRKGPYVRIGPGEIATNSKDGFECVYGVGKRNLDKYKTYDYFMNHGVRNVFTSLDARQHSHRRARVSLVYSKSFVQTSPHFRSILKSVLLGRIIPAVTRASQSPSGSLDVLPLLHAYAADSMSAFVFGLSESYNLVQDLDARQLWLDTFSLIYQSRAVTLLTEFGWFARCMGSLGVRLLPDGYSEARQRSEEWASRKVDRLDDRLVRSDPSGHGQGFADGDFPVLFSAVRDGMARDAGTDGDGAFVMNAEQRRETASECNDHIGIAFSYIFYQLSKHPEVQDELRKELVSMPDVPFLARHETNVADEQLAPPEDLQRLPLLNAVIREGLRLRNSPPSMDPRVTPPGRSSAIGPYRDMPPGVRVGAYTHLLHRSRHLFDDARVWNPYRWLSEGSTSASADGKNRALFAFGGGSRGCIGRHVANERKSEPLTISRRAWMWMVRNRSELTSSPYTCSDAQRFGGRVRQLQNHGCR